jgi:hypothetical protein
VKLPIIQDAIRRTPNPAKSSSGEHWPNIDRNCDTKVHTFGSGPEGHREVVLTHISHPFCPEFASQSISNRFGQVFSPWGQDGQAALGRRYHEGRRINREVVLTRFQATFQ